MADSIQIDTLVIGGLDFIKDILPQITPPNVDIVDDAAVKGSSANIAGDKGSDWVSIGSGGDFKDLEIVVTNQVNGNRQCRWITAVIFTQYDFHIVVHSPWSDKPVPPDPNNPNTTGHVVNITQKLRS